MGIRDQIAGDWQAALAALAWQVDLGVDEVIGDTAVDRYDLPAAVARPAPVASAPTQPGIPAAAAAPATLGTPQTDAVAIARAAAAGANNLDELRAALSAFDLCELKRGARNTVFADGNPAARLLILGEAPGRDEDIAGRPFVGPAGQMLDKMFAAIGLSRASRDPQTAIYITNVMPWRPDGNRDPSPAEVAMMLPFVERHIALVDPAVIVAMGNTPHYALTSQKGILRARGTWTTALGKPMLPMVHPAYLLRNPIAKREAWADLLAVQAHLRRPT